MSDHSSISLTAAERELIRDALSNFADHDRSRLPAIRLLCDRLSRADRGYPDITIGVYGGVVQWVTGNPFPIRICDYDGDEEDLPDVDANGQRCSLSFEPPSV